MKLTTKGRYAVTAMLDIALHQGKGPINLADIANRQEISLAYLEQLFAKLKRHALVESARGPGGGYRLKKPAAAISVAEVINAVDETVDATRCGGQQNCQGDLRCLTHDLWTDLSNQISTFLNGVSLGDLVQRKNVKMVSARQDVDASCTYKLMRRLDKNASVH
jgi:Rrf2 family iron-sulfur cluster assembly transcriptional regulator